MASEDLQKLRSEVMQELVSLSDFMVNDEQTSYELLLILARNTGDQTLLHKALDKIKSIEDPRQKSDALLSLLDEIELSLSATISDDPVVAEVQQPQSEQQ